MKNLAIISNRLPVALARDAGSRLTATPSPGGLVHALEPVLRRLGGRWIGWPGLPEEACDRAEVEALLDQVESGIQLVPVSLGQGEVDTYYGGFSNAVLWPLFHGLGERCRFDSSWWRSYCAVNQRFARRLIDDGADVAWVQDYQLLMVGDLVRRERPDACLGFFLHIPFPTPEQLRQLPWWREILLALLAYDLIGFQTRRDLGNFTDCLTRLAGIDHSGVGPVRVRLAGRTAVAAHFPIGIDAAAWTRRAGSPEVDRRIAELRASNGSQSILLGVDRLDYTKGLLERLEAYERMLVEHPELRGKVMLWQVVVPSREAVPDYAALREELDRAVGRVSGRYSTTGWAPVRYLYRSLSPAELAALYRMADVALVTPLCDGMNLVAKEYCAAQIDGTGVLVLGEGAGAAEELGPNGALLVAPRDIEQLAATFHRALTMEPSQRRTRMESLRRVVTTADVFRWAEGFLGQLEDRTRAPRPARPAVGSSLTTAAAQQSPRHSIG
jgi:alpha,alpha-trehalose-phosphate synthase [UDP-forming]